MAEFEPDTIDALVTDPPYGLGFMGKEWDKPGTFVEKKARKGGFDNVGGNHNPTCAADSARTRAAENRRAQDWHYAWAIEALRVLKPGAHLLAFGGTRTHHRLMCGLEDAGFEIRDCVMWVYGSGFPKSLDVSKQIDKAAGAEREIIGEKVRGDVQKAKTSGVTMAAADANRNNSAIFGYGVEKLTAPATDEAKQWNGWGTALKPAWEPVIVARKPLEQGLTVAQNVLKWGTGALNIDGCRVGNTVETWPVSRARPADGFPNALYTHKLDGQTKTKTVATGNAPPGRFPANLIHDGSDEVVSLFPVSKDGVAGKRTGQNGVGNWGYRAAGEWGGYGGEGSAARFFYTAKSSSSDRGNRVEPAAPLFGVNEPEEFRNTHPTVKPIALMEYLIKLVIRSDGLLLDCFLGSGSTLVAAKRLGIRSIGIESDEESCQIAVRRIQC